MWQKQSKITPFDECGPCLTFLCSLTEEQTQQCPFCWLVPRRHKLRSGGAWYPWLLDNDGAWCCQATPRTPGLPPFEWVLISNRASWKGRCAPGGMKGSCEPQRSPMFCEIHGLRSLMWRRQSFAANLTQDCLSKHIPKLGSCEQPKKPLCKSMCTAHSRRSAAQCAGSKVTGILPLASMLLD